MDMHFEADMLHDSISNFKNNLLKTKKYWIIYLILVVMGSLSFFGADNYAHPKMEIAIMIWVSLVGIF